MCNRAGRAWLVSSKWGPRKIQRLSLWDNQQCFTFNYKNKAGRFSGSVAKLRSTKLAWHLISPWSDMPFILNQLCNSSLCAPCQQVISKECMAVVILWDAKTHEALLHWQEDASLCWDKRIRSGSRRQRKLPPKANQPHFNREAANCTRKEACKASCRGRHSIKQGQQQRPSIGKRNWTPFSSGAHALMSDGP